MTESLGNYSTDGQEPGIMTDEARKALYDPEAQIISPFGYNLDDVKRALQDNGVTYTVRRGPEEDISINSRGAVYFGRTAVEELLTYREDA